MAGIRPGRAVRDADKVAWTRFSRRKPRRSYIKAMPHGNLHQYRMGGMKEDFDTVIHLNCLEPVIIRDNAMESARQTANKMLETRMAGNYYFIVRVYPHHVIRENKMIAGAGADRLQKGMRRAFGRPSNRAARLNPGTALFTIHTYKSNLPFVKAAYERAQKKLSGNFRIEVEEAN